VTELGPIRPDRTLMLVNPLSFRLSLPGAFSKLRKHAHNLGLEPHVVYGPIEIEPLLGPALDKGIDLIIIVGGDGTLQATASLLATEHAGQKAPPILMLGGGRTNYTAQHLGTQHHAGSIIEKALTQPHVFRLIDKATLEIHQTDHPSIHGFFVGGALVDHVIRDCHQYRASGRGRFRQGRYSTIWRVLTLGILGLFGKVNYKSLAMELQAEEIGKLQGPVRLFVATTLDEEQVQIHPYLPQGNGPIKVTAVLRKARFFWLLLPWLLLGRKHRALALEHGYFSGHAQEVKITGLGPICVDGQEYDLDPKAVTKLTAGPTYRFLSI